MNLKDLSIRKIESRIAHALGGNTEVTLTTLSAGDIPGVWRMSITIGSHDASPSFGEPDGAEHV